MGVDDINSKSNVCSKQVGNGNPLQYPCLENSVDKRAWQAKVHRVTESDTTAHTHAP